MGISANASLMVDYFALLPAAYYEATILQQRVVAPCTMHQSDSDEEESCRHFAYPSLAEFDVVRAEGGYVARGDQRYQVTTTE